MTTGPRGDGVPSETLRQKRIGAARLLAYDECGACVLVYCALVEARNDRTGTCHLSVRGLRETTGLGRDRVEHALVNLAALGLIEDTGETVNRATVWRVVALERTPLRNHVRRRAARIRRATREAWQDDPSAEDRSAPGWATGEGGA